MADVPVPNNADDYETYKRSAEYLEESMKCSVIDLELSRIQGLLARGMLASEDVTHALSVLIGTIEDWS